MAWFRLDDQMAFHAKIVAAGNEAAGAWARCGCWSSAQGTDGAVPWPVALTIATRPVWDRLVAVGLCDLSEDGESLSIHDFLDWNPTASEVARLRNNRAKAGRNGGKQKASKSLASARPLLGVCQHSVLANPCPIPSPDPNPEIQNAHTLRAGAREQAEPAAPPRQSASPDAARIAAELAKHPSLATLPPELPEILLGRAMARGTRLEWLAEAIAEAAADVAGQGLDTAAVQRTVRAYCDRARPKRPDAPTARKFRTQTSVQPTAPGQLEAWANAAKQRG